jgi:hypothetical protein
MDKESGEIDIESISPGLYFISFETDKGSGLKKLVISR